MTQKKHENNQLDLKDRKILLALDMHARKPYSQLAKELKLSKQQVEYRIKRLLEKNILRGFYPLINWHALGYRDYCRLYITLRNITKEDYERIFAKIKQHKTVFGLFESQGKYDLILNCWTPSLAHFKPFLDDFKQQYSPYLKRVDTSVVTHMTHLPNNYLHPAHPNTAHILATYPPKELTTDKLDQNILKLLLSNARLKITEIATKLNQSIKTITNRIKKLEANNIIYCYRTLLNYEALGFTYYKLFLFCDASPKVLEKIKQYLQEQHPVIRITEGVNILGDLDIDLIVESNEELYTFITQLRYTFPKVIEEYETLHMTHGHYVLADKIVE